MSFDPHVIEAVRTFPLIEVGEFNRMAREQATEDGFVEELDYLETEHRRILGEMSDDELQSNFSRWVVSALGDVNKGNDVETMSSMVIIAPYVEEIQRRINSEEDN